MESLNFAEQRVVETFRGFLAGDEESIKMLDRTVSWGILAIWYRSAKEAGVL